MLILECVKKKRCKGSNGVGYCSLPVFYHNTAVVTGGVRRARQACLCTRLRTCAHARVAGEACRDKPP